MQAGPPVLVQDLGRVATVCVIGSGARTAYVDYVALHCWLGVLQDHHGLTTVVHNNTTPFDAILVPAVAEPLGLEIVAVGERRFQDVPPNCSLSFDILDAIDALLVLTPNHLEFGQHETAYIVAAQAAGVPCVSVPRIIPLQTTL